MIVLFGAAGSGKSEQGRRLAEKYAWRWRSGGQLLRGRAETDEALGQKLLAGELVDDEMMTEMMREEILAAEAQGERLILDGYPRDVWQTKCLVECEGYAKKIELALVFEVPHDELRMRLSRRGREDDREEVIERRLKAFDEEIEQIVEILEKAGVKVARVDGSGTREAVQERVERVLEEVGLVEKE